MKKTLLNNWINLYLPSFVCLDACIRVIVSNCEYLKVIVSISRVTTSCLKTNLSQNEMIEMSLIDGDDDDDDDDDDYY